MSATVTNHEVVALEMLRLAWITCDEASGLGHIATDARGSLARATFDLFGAAVQGQVLGYLDTHPGATIWRALEWVDNTSGGKPSLYRMIV